MSDRDRDRPVQVVLVHHADAVPPHENAQRPLSQRGLAQAASLAARAREAGIRPDVIWHSGKLRARQTADAFLRACNPMAEFRMVRGLRPEDDPRAIARDLAAETRDVLLVSHLPLLPELAAILGSTSSFPMNGMIWLERRAERNYVARLAVGPGDAGQSVI